MRWFTGVAIGLGALLLSGLALRALNPLPSLQGRQATHASADTADTALGRALAPAAARHQRLSGIHLLPDPLQALAARIDLARSAERSIDAQYYIWHDDLAGGLLFRELVAAADRGVRVRLLLDDNSTAGLDPVLARLDAHPNIEVRLFNPFTIRSPRLVAYAIDFQRLNRRMHNKAFIVDNQAAIVGGRNIGDEYFGAGGGALFVDLDALAIGSVVHDSSAQFDAYWNSMSAYPAARVVAPPRRVNPEALEERAEQLRSDPEVLATSLQFARCGSWIS
jgi:putative cardiolipin synthase